MIIERVLPEYGQTSKLSKVIAELARVAAVTSFLSA